MPYDPRAPCTWPGCNTLVRRSEPTSPRCPAHPFLDRRLPDDKRPSSTARGYDRTWGRLRLMYLREHPKCEIAGPGCTIRATEVDHIRPLRAGGERLNQDNLQSVCRTCHTRKTREIDLPLIAAYRKGKE